jgi:tetratricopeptide (TPR) repeat protein
MLCLVVVCVLAVPPAAWSDDGLLARMAHLTTHYHEDAGRLDAGVKELERSVAGDPSPPALAMLAQITYLWADVRAATRDEKLAAYDRGRDAAERALKRDPRNVDARYWRAANVGRSIETKGGVEAALQGLGFDFVGEMKTILDMQPRYSAAYGFLGAYYSRLPWPLGDVDKAARMYTEGVALDPHGTQQRIGLAKILIDRKKTAEAREQLLRVLNETAPSNPAEWTLHHAPDARRLLEGLSR